MFMPPTAKYEDMGLEYSLGNSVLFFTPRSWEICLNYPS